MFITKWGKEGSVDGEFKFPADVVIDETMNVYVLDEFNRRVQKFDASGNFIGEWGSIGTEDRHVFVADYENDRIKKFEPGGATRVLAASAAPDQESIFAVQGRISFSYIFWSEMFNGNKFYDSFVRAAQSVGMTYSQEPQIECNGNGIGNETGDKSFAQNIHVGAETMSAGDMPLISGLSDPQTLTGGTSAQITVDSVIDADGVSRVWAVITPPDFDPGSPDNPVTDLPIMEFTAVTGDGYQANYNDFSVQGTYNIAVYATDRKGVMGIPAQTGIIQTRSFIKGDLDNDDDVDLTDAVIALKVLGGMDVSGQLRENYAGSGADVNEDNQAGLQELLYIFRKTAGM